MKVAFGGANGHAVTYAFLLKPYHTKDGYLLDRQGDSNEALPIADIFYDVPDEQDLCVQ